MKIECRYGRGETGLLGFVCGADGMQEKQPRSTPACNAMKTCTKPEDPGEEGNQILARVFRIVLEYNRVNIKGNQKKSVQKGLSEMCDGPPTVSKRQNINFC